MNNENQNNGKLVFDLFHDLIFQFMGVNIGLTHEYAFLSKKINNHYRNERNGKIEKDYERIKNAVPKQFIPHLQYKNQYNGFIYFFINKKNKNILSKLVIPSKYIIIEEKESQEKFDYFFKLFLKKSLEEKIKLFNDFIIKGDNYKYFIGSHFKKIEDYIKNNIFNFKAQHLKLNYETFINKIKKEKNFNINN